MKRTFDIIVSLILLTLTSPIIVIIAISIRFKMGAPILFKQKRAGKHGNAFSLYKFRTMKHLLDNQDELLADHLRLTALGTFLRKYSLDELPQFINVLKGDMSLVGPRPLLLEYLSLYTKEQNVRHDVKPGITGWAQVNGRNAITWEERFKMDTWYVKNQTLRLDLKILFMTIIKVIKKEGITSQDHASMEKFTGTKSRTIT